MEVFEYKIFLLPAPHRLVSVAAFIQARIYLNSPQTTHVTTGKSRPHERSTL
jgi:hypothetical protein